MPEAEENPDVPACRLYVVTPSEFDLDWFKGELKAALSGGDVASVQLRMKGVRAWDVEKAAAELAPIVKDAGSAFIINDDPALAKRVDADVVHLGQDDGSIKDARELLGPDASIGITCHDSKHLAFEAGEASADYVAFGAFFPSSTKVPKTMVTPEIITEWAEIAELPCVAIGGITPLNCSDIVKAGADFVAASSAIWDHDRGPAAAVEQFNRKIAEALE